MPNLDAGHYFFTALVPVCNDGIVEHRGMKSSPIHMVREALETLPTALQSQAAEEVGIQSPFARSDRTHLARIFVIDQPFYNGRDPKDSILAAIEGTNLLEAQACDALTCPYLAVSIDFDPVDPEGRGEPRAYLEHLWGVMAAELTEIFRYCYTFSQVSDATSFADFMLACQVETTMPFNDYWIEMPKLPSLSLAGMAVAPLAGLAIGIAGGFMHWWPWWAAVLIAILLFLVGAYIDYRIVMTRGNRPFPTSNAPLPQVLKALYLQQAFARFAIAHQEERDEAALGAAFRAFLARHAPRDLAAPTQPPGVVRTRFEGAEA